MNRFYHFPLVFLLCCCFETLSAQGLPRRPGEILVSLDEKAGAMDVARRLDPHASVEKVSDLLNIWLLRSTMDNSAALDWLRRQPEVRSAQFNHILGERTAFEDPLLPDDPLFMQQWHLINDGANGGVFDADLDAEQAWNISSGGLTPAGDTIVLAVIDGGLQATHSDLAANIRRNREEIPENGIDDDANGYVDDYWGWNVFTQNDHIQGSNTEHGTPVCAVMGATGNNGTGITGVNWHTKIMFVSASGTESAILSAYDYIWKARVRYNTTLGSQGAFVVAVNCSWGINFGQPEDAPIWCAAFDTLGASGIVSVAATANIPVNVDEVGDLPTACPSNYLISVTSLDRSDIKVESAAWGQQHIDVGAYGKDVFSASANGGYGTFTGTSFATPQVTGLIGLLYAAPCPNLIALAKTNPAEAAYWVKSLVLENTTPNLSLSGRTSTDGRLNLFNALRSYQNQCSDCPPPFALKAEQITAGSARLLWTVPPTSITVNLRWRVLGMGNWIESLNVTDSFWIQGLIPCTNYEFEVQSVCDKGVVSSWSPPFIFKTPGCCTTPAQIWMQSNTVNSAVISWEASSFDNLYRVGLRLSGNTNWVFYESGTNSFSFNGLLPCTLYEFKVQSRCDEWVTPFSSTFYFTTKGCGACNEISYCAAAAADASEEWIEWLQIGTWIHTSGQGGNGYQNFSNSQPTIPFLSAGSILPVSVAPGFTGAANKEYYRIFIDYNQDGDFLDASELAFDPGFALEGIAVGNIEIPATLTPGITRMRVVMKFTTPNDTPPIACGTFVFGQVEDYCVELSLEVVNAPVTADLMDQGCRIFPQPAREWAVVEIPDKLTEAVASLIVTDMTGRIILQRLLTETPGNSRIELDTRDWQPGIYGLQIRSQSTFVQGKLLKL